MCNFLVRFKWIRFFFVNVNINLLICMLNYLIIINGIKVVYVLISIKILLS